MNMHFRTIWARKTCCPELLLTLGRLAHGPDSGRPPCLPPKSATPCAKCRGVSFRHRRKAPALNTGHLMPCLYSIHMEPALLCSSAQYLELVLRLPGALGEWPDCSEERVFGDCIPDRPSSSRFRAMAVCAHGGSRGSSRARLARLSCVACIASWSSRCCRDRFGERLLESDRRRTW